MYRSTDAGATWTALPALPVTDINDVGRIELAVSKADPDKLWALVGSRTTAGFLGIFRFDETANTWTALAASGVTTAFGTQQTYDLVLAIDPRDPKRMFIAGVTAFRSTDGGATFVPFAREVHFDWHVIVFDPNNPDIMWAGTDGGVYLSTDAGGTWTSRSAGLAITQFYPGVSVHPQGTRIAGGTQDNGTQVFSGTPFWDAFLGADGGYTAINYRDPSIQWGETQWSIASNTVGNLFRRDITGSQRRSTGIVAHRPRAIHSAAGHGSGQSIEALLRHVPPVPDRERRAAVDAAHRRSDDRYRYHHIDHHIARRHEYDLRRHERRPRTRLARRWRDVRARDRPAGARRHARHAASDRPAPRARHRVGIRHRARVRDDGRVRDRGEETSAAISSTRRPTLRSTSLRPASRSVGTDVGVFQTADGVTWTAGPTGIPNVIIQDLVYQPAIRLLVAGTYGRGMFAYDVGASTAVLRGDANGDGKIDAFDALLIQQTLVGAAPAGTAVYPRGDANCNGNIDAADLVLVLRAAVGLPTGPACVGTNR